MAHLEQQKRGLPNYSGYDTMRQKEVKSMLIRKTVTLKEDTIAKIQKYADERGISFSAAINCMVYDAQLLGLVPPLKPNDDDSQK